MNIKAIREKLMYSQEEFAEILGVSRQSLSAWEDGRQVISPENYAIVVKILKKLSKNH